MNKIIKSLICLMLSLALLFSATACTTQMVTQEITESVTENTTGSNSGSSKNNAVSTDYVSKTEDKGIAVSGNNQSFITVTNTPTDKSDVASNNNSEKFAEFDSANGFITDEEWEDFLACLQEYEQREVFSVASECIAFDLYEATDGEVFQALAIVGDEMIPGIAFTDYTVLEKTSDTTIYNCGFVQLIESGSDVEIGLTFEDVEAGIAVVPYGEYDTSVGFIIGMGAAIPSFSGILNNRYFRYDQIADYAVSISVKENDRSVYDENIDLYNFDSE